jgi:uncharacterized protein (DUF433 family)
MWQQYVEQREGVLRGKPVIKDTRIGVDMILERITCGETIDDLLLAYPHLLGLELMACIAYGASLVGNETFIDVE